MHLILVSGIEVAVVHVFGCSVVDIGHLAGLCDVRVVVVLLWVFSGDDRTLSVSVSDVHRVLDV